MRLSSSSLEMASARISCSFRSAKLFTGLPRRLDPQDRRLHYIRNILITGIGAGLQMLIDPFRRPFEPFIRRFLHIYWRVSRGLTVGVRAVVFDGEKHV